MKHENCGGELKKFGKRGRYRCETCRKMLKVGTPANIAGPKGGYIQRQTRHV